MDAYCCDHAHQVKLLEGALLSLQLQLEAIQQQTAHKQEQIDFLTLENQWLRSQWQQQQFGPRSERTSLHTPQLSLFFAPIAVLPETPAQPAKKKRKPHGKRGRKSLWTDPNRVKEVRTRIEPTETHCPNCAHPLAELGVDETVQVERIPSVLERRITERVKRTCQHCKNTKVYQVPAPERTLDNVRIGDHLLASIVTDHLEYHLPLHRIERMLAAEGLHIHRATLGRYVHAVGSLLQPIVKHVEEQLCKSPWIGMDATWLPMQQKRACRRAAVWVAHGQDDQVVFRYTETAKKQDAIAPWKNYTGVVMCDAADVFDPLFLPQLPVHATRCNCNAHSRRKFVQALSNDRTRAQTALDYYQQLYAIEDELKRSTVQHRQQQRSERSTVILHQMHGWLQSQANRVAPRSPVDKAIQYAINHWPALTRYTEYGFVPIDNNGSEREIRHFVVGRKNWGFRARAEHAASMCVIYSLLAMCRRRHLEPRGYIAWALQRLSDPHFNVQDLTPQAYQLWLAQHTGQHTS